MECVRAMIAHADLIDSCWAEAVATAAYLRNRVPTALKGKFRLESYNLLAIVSSPKDIAWLKMEHQMWLFNEMSSSMKQSSILQRLPTMLVLRSE